ncbi:nuclear transport factor 2 family protein [Streptomyces mutomycini]|uniref:Nuclear transport factor 2 family protein n=1 Tax=Streptomyces mutomycini TaxID=284036 RepID=A0ABW0B9G4_9ACTN|nr:nuclear transport factor 2 family protein [Streptomyces mutomycini]
MHADEQLVRACLAAISKADADGWLASYADDAVSRDVPLDSVWNGRAELEAGVRSWLAAIPETRMEVRTVFVDDRSGACEWTMSGTLEGVLDGLPEQLAALAKGKPFHDARSNRVPVLKGRPHSGGDPLLGLGRRARPVRAAASPLTGAGAP